MKSGRLGRRQGRDVMNPLRPQTSCHLRDCDALAIKIVDDENASLGDFGHLKPTSDTGLSIIKLFVAVLLFYSIRGFSADDSWNAEPVSHVTS